MKILREYGINGDKKLRYNLTQPGGSSLADMIGQRVQVKAYILTEEDDPQTGDIKKTLKVITEDGDILGTRSASFIDGFEKFAVCMESDEITEFEVAQGRSKNGRNYLVFRA